MHFLVIGHDGATFGIADRDVDEEHQAYVVLRPRDVDARRRSAAVLGDERVFAGTLLDESGDGIGIAGALDLPEADAEAVFRRLAPDAAISVQRWRRGGRDQG